MTIYKIKVEELTTMNNIFKLELELKEFKEEWEAHAFAQEKKKHWQEQIAFADVSITYRVDKYNKI